MTAHTGAAARVVDDEFDLLAELVELRGLDIVELGCGSAKLVRRLLQRYPQCRVSALEVDARQHANNLAAPQPGLEFVAAGAQAIPRADGSFDPAPMLESLHHVPLPLMDTALAEVRRVLRPCGCLYVSEPVYDGAFNDVARLFNDEAEVRAAAQAAIDRALAGGGWHAARELRFDAPLHFDDFADFERRMVDVSFAERRLDAAKRAAVHARFAPHLGAGGADFTQPHRVRRRRKCAA